jgi:uncharacterized protein
VPDLPAPMTRKLGRVTDRRILHERLVPGTRHLDTAFRLLRSHGTGGNLTTDVQIAAHAVEYNGEVFSNDRDFGRFEGVSWVNPLE